MRKPQKKPDASLLKMIENKRAITFSEGCLLTGFRPSYMYKLTASGIVPHSKPGGKRIFFDRLKLEAWMLSNPRPGSDENESKAAAYCNTKI